MADVTTHTSEWVSIFLPHMLGDWDYQLYPPSLTSESGPPVPGRRKATCTGVTGELWVCRYLTQVFSAHGKISDVIATDMVFLHQYKQVSHKYTDFKIG